MTYAAERHDTAQEAVFGPLGPNSERDVVSAYATSRIISTSLIIVLVLILILGITGSFAS